MRETPTADLIWRRLPVAGRSDRWGDEIALALPLEVDVEEEARQVVERGALGYWCEGQTICIALGPTPISLAGECRLVAPVNVWGRLAEGGEALLGIEPGATLRISRRAS